MFLRIICALLTKDSDIEIAECELLDTSSSSRHVSSSFDTTDTLAARTDDDAPKEPIFLCLRMHRNPTQKMREAMTRDPRHDRNNRTFLHSVRVYTLEVHHERKILRCVLVVETHVEV